MNTAGQRETSPSYRCAIGKAQRAFALAAALLTSFHAVSSEVNTPDRLLDVSLEGTNLAFDKTGRVVTYAARTGAIRL